MVAFNFQPHFAAAVETGDKRQTIRPRRRFASARIGFVVLGVPALVSPAVGIQLISFALFSVFYIHWAGGYLNAGEFFAVTGMFFSAFLGVFRLADINLFAIVPKGIGPAFFGHLLVLLFWGWVVIGDDNSCDASTAQGGVAGLVGTCPKDFWLEWTVD